MYNKMTIDKDECMLTQKTMTIIKLLKCLDRTSYRKPSFNS